MVRWLLVLFLLLLAAAGALYWWVHRPQQAALDEARQQLQLREREIEVLRGQVGDLEAVRDRLQAVSTELRQAVVEKEKQLEAVRSTQDELVASLQQEISDQKVQVERIRDRLRVDMVDEVLFDSGEATLKPAGVEVMRKVGAILKKAADRRVEVQGHTDNVPIRGALATRFPTNWELSAARSINVVRFLQDQAGLDPKLLYASASSEYRPRDTNDTDQGRRRNRRIEILLVPVSQPEGGGGR